LEPVKPQFQFTRIWNWNLGSNINTLINRQNTVRQALQLELVPQTSNYDKSFAFLMLHMYHKMYLHQYYIFYPVTKRSSVGRPWLTAAVAHYFAEVRAVMACLFPTSCCSFQMCCFSGT
jgi:hypothetical protein